MWGPMFFYAAVAYILHGMVCTVAACDEAKWMTGPRNESRALLSWMVAPLSLPFWVVYGAVCGVVSTTRFMIWGIPKLPSALEHCVSETLGLIRTAELLPKLPKRVAPDRARGQLSLPASCDAGAVSLSTEEGCLSLVHWRTTAADT